MLRIANAAAFGTHKVSGSKRTGLALVLVLVFLVLITTLVLAFFSSVSTDLTGAKSYAGEATTKQLSDSAVQLVMAQIRLATSGGDKVAWASQPGMIRTYDDAGTKTAYFKLYSSKNMVVSREETESFSFFDEDLKDTASDELTDWSGKPAIFTDLNAPVAGGSSLIYPIVNPGATASVPGFRVRIGEESPVQDGENLNPIPMPVKWIYVLRDGTLTAPSQAGSSGKMAVWSGTAIAPHKDNPIVGRIAFWTDDETCKVNVNTASEGVYADTPRLGSAAVDDTGFKTSQPVNREYQRYPGHPAMTSLSAVFPDLTSNDIYELIPRIGTGGSVGGTVQTVLNASAPMVNDPDRLYASVEEFAFRPGRAPNHPALDVDTLEKAKFFLTTTSRAPELNLFNKPRVSIWPIALADDEDHRSPYDRLIAFCSTVNNFPFYFQRSDPESSVTDLPEASSDSGLQRNRKLLEYLRYLTDQPIPGFGGSFGNKYGQSDVAGLVQGNERDQILTEVFDYIRATNLADANVTEKYSRHGQVVPIEDTTKGTRGFGRFRTMQGANLLFICNSEEAGIRTIQAIFLPQLYDVSVGSVFNSKQFTVSIRGLDRLEWDNGSGLVSMGFPPNITATLPKTKSASGAGAFYDKASYGDQLGFRQFVEDCFSELQSEKVTIPAAAGTFLFSGGVITFDFYDRPGGNIVQTARIELPQQQFPLPKLSPEPARNARNGSVADTIRTFPSRKLLTLNGKEKENHDHWTTAWDVIRGVTCDHGDLRLIAARKRVPDPGTAGYPFAINPKYTDTTSADQTGGAHNLWTGDGYPYSGAYAGKLAQGSPFSTTFSQVYPDVRHNGVALGKRTPFTPGDIPGDWDTGVAEIRDGPYINKPDEGDYGKKLGSTVLAWPYKWKYETGQFAIPTSLFTPNRQVASAVTFGSLPTGVLADKPWQTLLFRPGPAGHPGLGAPHPGVPPYQIPPDHILLDLFHMPVVEPYAISEPLSTAGKINLNYQIAPFTYITRDAGLRAVLKSERVITIKTDSADLYKLKDLSGLKSAEKKKLEDRFSKGMIRQEINIDATLAEFDERFDSGDIFRSASEICDIDLIPADYSGLFPATRQSMDDYWSSRLLTGDNCRERPYATIYPRVTTKSNTYTVHIRVQTLKKVKGTRDDVWDETRDVITGEYRGSHTIERYVDAEDPALPDFADPMEYNSDLSIERFYKFRTLASRRFCP